MGRIKELIIEREQQRKYRRYHPDKPEEPEESWDDILKDQEPFPWDVEKPEPDDYPESGCPNYQDPDEEGDVS